MLVVAGNPGVAQASPFFPESQCAVIVASRPTISEARQWIRDHQWSHSARVFLGSNGWYAISATTVSRARSEELIRAGKQHNLYPDDAYCSIGKSYVREVDWDVSPSASGGLAADFDARALSSADKEFLQGGLALYGYYTGLLDGAWGQLSQTALTRLSRQEFQREPKNIDAAYVSFLTYLAITADGWERYYFDRLAVSAVLPMHKIRLTEADGTWQRWEHVDRNLSVSVDDFSYRSMGRLHNSLANDREMAGRPYIVRNERLWITSVQFGSGTIYMRSDLIQGTWSTVTVGAPLDLQGEMALITGSILIGRGHPFAPSEGGALMQHTTAFAEWMEDTDETDESTRAEVAVSPPTENSDQAEDSSGTGFFVNADGILLTNAHVVKGCNRIVVDGITAEIVAVSSAFDLAAVEVSDTESGDNMLAFSDTDSALNADITIAGYPLHGLLGGLNVSRGSVSALKGLSGDETNVQISAPVQPGNSGGPMIDRFGNVVGVVVAKLNAMKLASLTGDIAQNVNFAIRGSIAKVFLQTNGIDFEQRPGTEPLSPEDAAKMLMLSTRLIECRVE